MTRTEEGLFLVPQRKVSSKRCLSPSKATLQDSTSGIKRKSQNNNNNHNCSSSSSGLLQLQQHVDAQQLLMWSHAENSSSPPSSDATAVAERCWPAAATGLVGAATAAAAVMAASGGDPEDRLSQAGDEYSAAIPDSYNSLESTSVPWSDSHQMAESRRSSCATAASQYSSSFTSWTRPEAGHRLSDSCVPNSSILDRESAPRSVYRSRSVRKTSRKSSFKVLKRDSSADTSKDIDDIEDFELDDGGLVEDLLHDDFEEHEELIDEEYGGREPVGLAPVSAACGATVVAAKMAAAPIERERKRSSFVMASPDLAYGSLNPSSGEF